MSIFTLSQYELSQVSGADDDGFEPPEATDPPGPDIGPGPGGDTQGGPGGDTQG